MALNPVPDWWESRRSEVVRRLEAIDYTPAPPPPKEPVEPPTPYVMLSAVRVIRALAKLQREEAS